jgi:4'-phosphopantetheinyl transferase EntD
MRADGGRTERQPRRARGITALLPPGCAAYELSGDIASAPFLAEGVLVAADAPPERQAEFAAVRLCARRALADHGVVAGQLPPRPGGAPAWPNGIVGSMTHCSGYCAAAVARTGDLLALGIDAEPHAELPLEVRERVASAGELRRLEDLSDLVPQVHWDRVLFCAKEAIFKAWSPLTGRWLGFRDAEIHFDDTDRAAPAGGPVRARLLVPGPMLAGIPLTEINGRWSVADGLVRTAVSVPNPG